MPPTAGLADVADVIRGVSFDKHEASGTQQAGFVPILRAGNIGATLDTKSDLIWVPSSRVTAQQRLKTGDIAICMSSGSQTVVGKTAVVRSDWDGAVGAFCAVIRPRVGRIVPEFLAFYLRSAEFRKWTLKSEGANIKNIRRSELLAQPVPCPSDEEQRRIVDLLSRAENIVRMRREAEAKAKEIVPALFQETFGEPAGNPKGFTRVPLGSLLVDGPKNGLYKHASLYGIGTPILRIDSFYDGFVQDIGALRRVRITPEERNAFSLEVGDIVVNRVNSPEYLGKSAIVLTLSEPVVFESNMMRLRLKTDLILPEYVIQLLQMPGMRHALVANAKHAINQSSINQGDVKGLTIPVPPLQSQACFVELARALREMQHRQVRAARIAEDMFGSLLNIAFRNDGERDREQILAQGQELLCTPLPATI